MKSNSFTTVYKTFDYTAFKFMKGNRSINLAKMNRLKESMKQEHLLSPIIVNDNYEIIDGQNRFCVSRDLGLPVYYIVAKGYALPQILRYNSNLSNWSDKDFTESYIDLGYKDYKVYKEFRETWKFGHSVCLKLLSGDKNRINQDFKDGLFRVTDIEKAEEIARQLHDFALYYKNYRNRSFVAAIAKISRLPKYKHSTMISKLQQQQTSLVDCPNTDSYIRLLEAIYNYRSSSGRLRFL